MLVTSVAWAIHIEVCRQAKFEDVIWTTKKEIRFEPSDLQRTGQIFVYPMWSKIYLQVNISQKFTRKLQRRKETHNSICNSDSLILKLKAHVLIWFARLIQSADDVLRSLRALGGGLCMLINTLTTVRCAQSVCTNYNLLSAICLRAFWFRAINELPLS